MIDFSNLIITNFDSKANFSSRDSCTFWLSRDLVVSSSRMACSLSWFMLVSYSYCLASNQAKSSSNLSLYFSIASSLAQAWDRAVLVSKSSSPSITKTSLRPNGKLSPSSLVPMKVYLESPCHRNLEVIFQELGTCSLLLLAFKHKSVKDKKCKYILSIVPTLLEKTKCLGEPSPSSINEYYLQKFLL